MRKLLWSPQALRDLEGIREYIAIDSARYAALEKLRRAADNPLATEDRHAVA